MLRLYTWWLWLYNLNVWRGTRFLPPEARVDGRGPSKTRLVLANPPFGPSNVSPQNPNEIRIGPSGPSKLKLLVAGKNIYVHAQRGARYPGILLKKFLDRLIILLGPLGPILISLGFC